MAIKFNNKLSLLLLTLSLLLLPSHCYTKEEEESAEGELFECFVKCGKARQNDRELSECEERCVKKYQERKREEREEGGGSGGGGGGDEWSMYAQTDEPRKVYERCERQCDKQSAGSKEEYQCRRACEYQYEEMKKHQEQHGGEGGITENHHQLDPKQHYKECRVKCGRQLQCRQKCKWDYEQQKRQHGDEVDVTNPRKESQQKEHKQSDNPYFFDSQRFDSKFKTEEGHIKVLERFTKKSELLQGIDNYRLAILEANPNTFVLPHHCDAESVFFVVGGKGTISYVWNDQRQSYNLKQGDVMRVPAGSIVYLINRDDNERLYVLKLLQPVNIPGRFKEYFGVGGENPESFYRAFSNDVLEAAFNKPKEKLEKLFGQQRKGVIIKASKEQIRALSQESEASSRGRKEESWGPFNLMDQHPLFSNRFGEYVEASPKDFDQLKDLDVAVGFMNIKKGGMIAPYYNSRSTKLVFVIGGSGYFEMACPHLSAHSQGRKEKQGEQTRTNVHYEKVRARLSVGDAFVIPAGHPIAIIADSNLQLASFGIKGSHNQKYFLAGQENVWNQVQAKALELSFKMPAEEVEEIFRSQEESYFVRGPEQREKGKGHFVASVLDFVGFY